MSGAIAKQRRRLHFLISSLRQRRKLCRTKNLVMIIGISSSKTGLLSDKAYFCNSKHDTWISTSYLLLISNHLPGAKPPYNPIRRTCYPHSNINFSLSSPGSPQTISNSISANGKEPPPAGGCKRKHGFY